MKTTVSQKLSFFLLLASLIPLLSFGILSVYKVRQATMKSVQEGHQNVSQRAAEQIEQYVKNAITIVQVTAENMNHAGLETWQEERILENYLSQFSEFNEFTLFDENKNMIATTQLKKVSEFTYKEESLKALNGQSYVSPVYIKDDLSPAMRVAFPIKKLTQVTGVLVAEINLMHMWYLVDHIKIGESGYLNVLDAEGQLIASGNGERKKEVFNHKKRVLENMLTTPFQMGEPLKWSVVVEQPLSEAFALAHQMTSLLLVVMIIFILLALGVGVYAGRKQIVSPIQELMKATSALAQGNLDYIITLKTDDEFEVLGASFNDMIVKLKDIQKKLVIEERHALFGRVASGLAHDLKHPIQAIENVSRLMEKNYADPEFRETFRRTVEREFEKTNHFLTDLHNIVHEVPFHPLKLRLNDSIREALATFESKSHEEKVSLSFHSSREKVFVSGDRSGLNRVFSNLISNALQAMNSGGSLVVSLESRDGWAIAEFRDTGIGIDSKRIPTLFEDFVTTKSRGLGLGLAIIKKMVAAHKGIIEVESDLGVGSCFRIKIPQIIGE